MFFLSLSETTGRGIIIYTKENLKATEVTLTNTYSDIFLLKITYNISKTLLFGSVYRSEIGSQDNNLNLLKAIREVYELHGDMTVIVGDFNLPHINWENWSTGSDSPSSLSFQFIECLRDCYFNQHILKATRGRGHNNPSLLDLIITPNDTTIDNLEFCSPLGKSDHSVLKVLYRLA